MTPYALTQIVAQWGLVLMFVGLILYIVARWDD